jgi:histidyl-tRNA synthetase
VAVIGGSELQEGVMNVKCMRDSSQERVSFENAEEYFTAKEKDTIISEEK